jgi:hypothetical protein
MTARLLRFTEHGGAQRRKAASRADGRRLARSGWGSAIEPVSPSYCANCAGKWLAALDDFRNWLIREAA